MEIYPGKMVYSLLKLFTFLIIKYFHFCILENYLTIFPLLINNRLWIGLKFAVKALHVQNSSVSPTTLMPASSVSFLVDACTCLLGHLDTEGLFRKSGSIVRVKALRVSDLSWHLWLSVERPWLGFHVKQWLHCYDSVGEVGSGRRVPVLCAALGRSWALEAVPQGAAWASSGHRPTEQLSESPGAAHFRWEDLSNTSAVLCVDAWEFTHSAILLQLSEKRISEVSWGGGVCMTWPLMVIRLVCFVSTNSGLSASCFSIDVMI